MKEKQVSVIMGIYNCENTLGEAIESIIGQTYTSWQLILCDDCSTDQTYQIAQEYQTKYPDKIILVRNERNSRLAYSLNHCLQYATGEYVARMDGDDISKPERFEKQIDYLENHPELQVVGCAMQHFNDQGLADIVYAVDKPDYFTLRNRIPYHHATIIMRKSAYDELGGYTVSERTNRAQDYDLWFRFYHAGFNGDNLREPLYLVREDAAAIRRRTFKVRWNAFKTTRYGFALLNYPRWWLIKPCFKMVYKSLTPFVVVEMYRNWQKNKR